MRGLRPIALESPVARSDKIDVRRASIESGEQEQDE
jgi:hypothetical protein